jgi:DNA-binding Lrp family transcriptional regulator
MNVPGKFFILTTCHESGNLSKKQIQEPKKYMIDDLDKKIISLLQGDIPVEAKPYANMAAQLGISEGLFLERVQAMIDRKIIRRFGATLYHQKAGFKTNVMVAWNVPDDIIDETGEKMAQYSEVSHCYHRLAQKDFKYNLYTMVHTDSREQCIRTAERMSRETGIKDYSLLFSKKEFKKSSMEYF